MDDIHPAETAKVLPNSYERTHRYRWTRKDIGLEVVGDNIVGTVVVECREW